MIFFQNLSELLLLIFLNIKEIQDIQAINRKISTIIPNDIAPIPINTLLWIHFIKSTFSAQNEITQPQDWLAKMYYVVTSFLQHQTYFGDSSIVAKQFILQRYHIQPGFCLGILRTLVNTHILQAFLTSVLLPLWTGQSQLWGVCPVDCRMFGSMAGPLLLPAVGPPP